MARASTVADTKRFLPAAFFAAVAKVSRVLAKSLLTVFFVVRRWARRQSASPRSIAARIVSLVTASGARGRFAYASITSSSAFSTRRNSLAWSNNTLASAFLFNSSTTSS